MTRFLENAKKFQWEHAYLLHEGEYGKDKITKDDRRLYH